MPKRWSLLILISIMFVPLCSCAASSQRASPNTGVSDIPVSKLQSAARNAYGIDLEINHGIFDLSTCLPGFTPTAGCNFYTYRWNDIHLSLGVYGKTTPIEGIYPGGIASFEKRTENGLDYYYSSSGPICWDGVDEETGKATGGETTMAEVIIYIDEYIVILAGSTENGDISAVTPRLAMDLLGKAPIDGLEQLGCGLSTRFYKGTLECNISLIPKDDAEYQRIFDTEGTVVQEEDNIRYLASIRERSQDDPNVRFIVCDTDKGALLTSCGVPYAERNNVPAEELDFINFSLAKNIAKGLGVVINSIVQ